MKEEIISKLTKILSIGKYDEAAVTYIFVEIRKIFEKENLYDKFPLISFYSDWVAHSYLDRKQANEYLKRIEVMFNGEREHDSEVQVGENMKSSSPIHFNNLKLELHSFLKEQLSLEGNILDKNWNEFLNSLIGIIANSPLIMKDETSFIEKFVFIPQFSKNDVIFEITLRSGIVHCVTNNFTYLELN